MTFESTSRDLNQERLRLFLTERFPDDGEIPACFVRGEHEFAFGDTIETTLAEDGALSRKYIRLISPRVATRFSSMTAITKP